MDNEPYRELTHHEAAEYLATMMRSRGLSVRREVPLPSGKIADVLVQDNDGKLSIYEVKTELKASLIEAAQRKYAHWCHRLYIAIPHLTWTYLEDQTEVSAWRHGRERVGVIGVYRDALMIFRPAIGQPMPPELYRSIAALLKTP